MLVCCNLTFTEKREMEENRKWRGVGSEDNLVFGLAQILCRWRESYQLRNTTVKCLRSFVGALLQLTCLN